MSNETATLTNLETGRKIRVIILAKEDRDGEEWFRVCKAEATNRANCFKVLGARLEFDK